MSWIKLHKRSAVLIGLTILLPVYLYISILIGLVSIRGEGVDAIERIEPRLGRLIGLLQSEEALKESASLSKNGIEDLVYSASENSETVAANLQSKVRQILTDAGLNVVDSQVLSPVMHEAFQHIGLRLTARGSLVGLDAALAEIAAYRPILVVEVLEARPLRTSRRGDSPVIEQSLNVTLQVFSLRTVK